MLLVIYFQSQYHSLLLAGSQPKAYAAFCTFTALSLGQYGTITLFGPDPSTNVALRLWSTNFPSADTQ